MMSPFKIALPLVLAVLSAAQAQIPSAQGQMPGPPGKARRNILDENYSSGASTIGS